MPQNFSFHDIRGAALVSASDLHAWLHDGDELALIDIHEAGQYGEGHALLAANIPYSELEPQFAARVPRLTTRVVLVGPAQVAQQAVLRLSRLGYTHLHVLDGDTAAWGAAGYPVFKGIYVPSKAFAECVELSRHTPTLEPDELNALLQSGEDVVVLDSRTAKEYARFHVPGAINCPGSELLYRLETLVPSHHTHVVISCAGRTRGIMGGQTLVDAQVPYKVSVLSGGTQGWKLAGFGIEKSPSAPLPEPAWAASANALQRAQALAAKLGIAQVNRSTLSQWQADTTRTTWLIDVRDPSEAKANPIPGATAVAGVQLLQTTDTHFSVHGARLVLADDQGVRALTTAYWLHQQGWEVAVLAADESFVVESENENADADAYALKQGQTTTDALVAATALWTATEVAQALTQGALVVSVQPSEVFIEGHVPGAIWTHRAAIATGALDTLAAQEGAVRLVVAENALAGVLAAQEWQERLPQGAPPVAVFVADAAGLNALAQQGAALVRDAVTLTPGQRVDYLFWLHDRHTGNAESSRQYLQWEAQLPAQIGPWQEARFRILQEV